MSPRVLTVVRCLLGAFFVLAGLVKVTDLVSPDVHQHMKEEFSKFSTVFPLAPRGWRPPADLYMATVGWMELLPGILLALGPTPLQTASGVLLLVIMIGAIYSLLSLGLPLVQCLPAAVCCLLLLLLLLLKAREPVAAEGRLKTKTS
ncbi:transmembrane protein 35B [Petromyzon marinus]|uniref:transmembrane protein 35B n=1 Tax=Petromyzon marinus TaxID=7757 RepID=UPI003F710049